MTKSIPLSTYYVLIAFLASLNILQFAQVDRELIQTLLSVLLIGASVAVLIATIILLVYLARTLHFRSHLIHATPQGLFPLVKMGERSLINPNLAIANGVSLHKDSNGQEVIRAHVDESTRMAQESIALSRLPQKAQEQILNELPPIEYIDDPILEAQIEAQLQG